MFLSNRGYVCVYPSEANYILKEEKYRRPENTTVFKTCFGNALLLCKKKKRITIKIDPLFSAELKAYPSKKATEII